VTLDRVFQLEETRVLSNDWVIRYDTRYFQVARQSITRRPPGVLCWCARRSRAQSKFAIEGAADAKRAPTAPCNTRRRVSPSVHRPSPGDISISLKTGTFLFRVDIPQGKILQNPKGAHIFPVIPIVGTNPRPYRPSGESVVPPQLNGGRP
jgi:hypothetical protein